MSSSIVYRKDVVEALYQALRTQLQGTFTDSMSLAMSMAKELPEAEPEQQWIPSDEKPPEKGSYLVWMPFALPERRITVAEYCGGYWNIKTPISAWMPLPEPYAERRTDERFD